jgi:hypothetical protein
LEVDGVVFDLAQFPRTDADYVAQLKKLAVDLGLTVAALGASDAFASEGSRALELAVGLGAPIVTAPGPEATSDPAAWGAFADRARSLSSAAKAANVTLALRNAPGTLCESASDLRRLAKDVDSAWLRFAPEPATFGTPDEGDALLSKSVIAYHAIEQQATFATPADEAAPALIRALARFRGFVVLERDGNDASREGYHRALDRFAALRSNALTMRPA